MGITEYKFENTRVCPSCGYTETKVIDSRVEELDIIKRRRVCKCCKFRYNTYEVTEIDLEELVSGYRKNRDKRDRNSERLRLNSKLKDVQLELCSIAKMLKEIV